ncbi:MAG: phosphoribosylformylglycinamidine synthase subunit PurQ [Bacteroidetes bacterium]|jgi:phosphoribosylformylglycinamidine synthase|nr:phosphoribosylformylglycinamidine synthase subunit PurQ [Bacteroidota bacterium]
MKFGVVVFPGSNCDDDMVHVLGRVMGQDVHKIWHKETDLSEMSPSDCIVLPGGFSYGDYLRSGAIASQSPIISSVRKFAESGGRVIGICNGFQILCEMGLLPGALVRNKNQKFISRVVHLKVEEDDSLLTRHCAVGDILRMPVAHAEGRYFIPSSGLKTLRENKQILFTYTDAKGAQTDETNINGSVDHIAGIRNRSGNIVGMMPHPERASEMILGLDEARVLFESLVA